MARKHTSCCEQVEAAPAAINRLLTNTTSTKIAPSIPTKGCGSVSEDDPTAGCSGPATRENPAGSSRTRRAASSASNPIVMDSRATSSCSRRSASSSTNAIILDARGSTSAVSELASVTRTTHHVPKGNQAAVLSSLVDKIRNRTVNRKELHEALLKVKSLKATFCADGTTIKGCNTKSAKLTSHQEKKPRKMYYIKCSASDNLEDRPLKPLGERCQLCRIDLAFTLPELASDRNDPQVHIVLPCGHCFHNTCLESVPHLLAETSEAPLCLSCNQN